MKLNGKCRPNKGSYAMTYRFLAIVVLVGATFFSSEDPVQAEQPTRDLCWFLRRMRVVDHLPELEASHTAMSSTWDRTGGNVDGTDFKDLRIGNSGGRVRNVLLDIAGPGCIHRLFVGRVGQQQAGTRIQVFLDGADKAVFDMPIVEFFDDTGGFLPYPLVFHKSYPGTLFPIPFEKHCLVQLVNDGFGQPGWKSLAWSNYWQITYTRYQPNVKVKSLSWPLDTRERNELQATCKKWLEAEANPPAEPSYWTVDKKSSLEPGGAMNIDLSGAGVIRQMRVRVVPQTPDVLHNLQMQIWWDSAKVPSVDVPVGYFFGHAHCADVERLTSPAAVLGKRQPQGWAPVEYTWHFNSLLLGATDAEAYCCFPMPFADGTLLTFKNMSKDPIRDLHVRLQVEKRDRVPDNWGRFHVTWTSSRAATDSTTRFGPKSVPGKVVLKREGRGKYVGVLLSVDWPHLEWWGEGDWLIWTDQEGWPPDYHGTGSEEYFNSGWCRFDRKAVSGFVTLRPGHPTVYSFHLNDAFQFQRRILVVEEQMGNGNGEQLLRRTHPLWSSTAYWYGHAAQAAESNGKPLHSTGRIEKQ